MFMRHVPTCSEFGFWGCLGFQDLLRHVSDLLRLADAQIQHHLLRAPWNSHSSNLPAQALNLLTLTASRVREAAEDLGGLASTILEDLRALHLEQGSGSTELRASFYLVHRLHL